MAQQEHGSISNKIDEKTKNSPRWGWSSITARANTTRPESVPAQVPVPFEGKKEIETPHPEHQAAVLAPIAQRTIHEPKQDDLIGRSVESEQLQQHSCGEDMVASVAKPKSQTKSSAVNSKNVQDEPEVRINIIVDPDSGETVGTVTLLDTASARPSCLDMKERPNSVQDIKSPPIADAETHTLSENEPRSGCCSDMALAENENLSCDARQIQTPDVEDTAAENPQSEPEYLSDSLPTDLYSHMTPLEAAAEQKRLESWINWAIITGRDPKIWQQRRKVVRKRAARRRVLKRRAGVYSQRFKDALLLREGHHATHASFNVLRETA